MKKTIDELLQTPAWIIDILPERVPADSPGHYFAVENYFLEKEQLSEIKRKHINLILKLNCYYCISLDEDPDGNPPPIQIAGEMRMWRVCLMMEDSMIVSEPDSTHMTLYNPDPRLLDLIRTLAAGEGLYVWR